MRTMPAEHERIMDLCLAESRVAWALGNSPIAAAVGRDGTIVGLGRNAVATACDPTAHAVMDRERLKGGHARRRLYRLLLAT